MNSVQRYDPGVANTLEDYLAQQVSNDEYDPYANLALLKLIQFNEQLGQPDVDDPDSPDTVSLLLVKALAHDPFGPDFDLCVAMLSDRLSPVVSSSETVEGFRLAMQLSTLLKQRHFVKFWALQRSQEVTSSALSPAIQSLPSFANLVRKSIAGAIADTFRSIERSRASSWLGFTEADSADGQTLDAFAKDTMSWTVEGDNLRIPSTEANDPKSSVQSEHVDLTRESAVNMNGKKRAYCSMLQDWSGLWLNRFKCKLRTTPLLG